MTDWQIIQGDCREVLAGMDDQSVDAIITDPPFFLPARHYAARKRWPRSLADLSILEHFFRGVIADFARVIKPMGHCLMFCDAQSYPVFYSLAYTQFDNVIALVWNKGRIGLGRPWRNQHELILACWQAGATLYGNRACGTVLDCAVVSSKERKHPAQKPLALLRHLIEVTTPKGGLVCDPFLGSGSVALAAIHTERRFLGSDLDSRYCDMARQRIIDDCPMWNAGEAT